MPCSDLNVRHSRQSCCALAALSGGREDREQPDGDPGGGGVDVDPEGDPGEDDDEHGGHVDLDEEVSHVPTQDEPNLKA